MRRELRRPFPCLFHRPFLRFPPKAEDPRIRRRRIPRRRSGFAARRGRAAAPKDVPGGVQVEKNLQLRRRLRGNAEDDGGGIFFEDDFRDAQFAVEPASGEERVFREAFFPIRRRRGREAFAPKSERFQGKRLPRRRRVGFAVHGVAVFLFSPFAGTRGCVFFLRADFQFFPAASFFRAASPAS